MGSAAIKISANDSGLILHNNKHEQYQDIKFVGIYELLTC